MINPTDDDQMAKVADLISLSDVTKVYKGRRRGQTVAVNEVSFGIAKGRIAALVGESGSGKSTIARLVTGIEKPTSGSIVFGQTHVNSLAGRHLAQYRKHVQMIFQDPYASLNPHNTVLYTITRPLVNHRGLSAAEAQKEALRVMDMVRLSPTDQYLNKRPHLLSGGQRQRLVIARAIAAQPDLVVADEPVSMLDVSIRADVLHLIADLRERIGMAVLYITHDLLSARVLADEVLVLYRGHLVERGTTDEVIRHGRHPYTRLLLESIPNPWREGQSGVDADSSLVRPQHHKSTSSQAIASGCPFVQRCPIAQDRCEVETPPLVGDDSHQAACFYS